MKKEIGSLALGLLLAASANVQTLQDKVKSHIAEGKIIKGIIKDNVNNFKKK